MLYRTICDLSKLSQIVPTSFYPESTLGKATLAARKLTGKLNLLKLIVPGDRLLILRKSDRSI